MVDSMDIYKSINIGTVMRKFVENSRDVKIRS